MGLCKLLTSPVRWTFNITSTLSKLQKVKQGSIYKVKATSKYGTETAAPRNDRKQIPLNVVQSLIQESDLPTCKVEVYLEQWRCFVHGL